MKKLTSATLSSLLIPPFWAQNRPLSVAGVIYYAVGDDSQPVGYRSLSPETLRYLQWVGGTQHYPYASDIAYEVFNVQGKRMTSFGTAPYSSIEYIDKDEAVLTLNNKYQQYNYHTQQTIAEISLPGGAADNDYDSKNKPVAYTLKDNLYIVGETNPEIAITAFTGPNIVVGGVIHRNEFGIQKGTFFSLKGSLLASYQKDENRVADYSLVDITTTPTALKAIKYPMAGQDSKQVAAGVYDLQTKKLIYLDADTRDEHFLTNLAWGPDERYLLLAEVNREQNHFALNRYDATTGRRVSTTFEESNPEWVEPENPAVFLPTSNNEFLRLSECDEFMNVYHCNTNRKLIKQLTHFCWVIQDILGFDSKGENFSIVGTGADPREKRCLKISLKNPRKITTLTITPGTHKVQLSSDGKYLLGTYSNVNIPKNINLINTEEGSAKRLLTTANPLEGFVVGIPEPLALKTDDGTTLYAKVHESQDFDPQRKYPVLIYVCGGPHAQEVRNSWGVGSYLWLSTFAQNDQYIVFTLDNRGSENRGFVFESAIHRHLGDYEVKDQLTGVACLKNSSYVDTDRIIVHGWGFGGFMASNLLTCHPGISRTAVVRGAVIDWKYYEVMHGKRYMDTPQTNPEGYENSRVNKYLGGLKRPLLFIHGSVDDIVVPQHLMSLTKELISKNNFIEIFFYPVHAHDVNGLDRINLTERIIDYIKKHNQ